jgi:hypothetical protein
VDLLLAAWSLRAIGQGETKTEALENIKEAISLILEVLRENLESLNRTNAEVLKVELADVFFLSCRSSPKRS